MVYEEYVHQDNAFLSAKYNEDIMELDINCIWGGEWKWRHFADIFKCISINEKPHISVQILLLFGFTYVIVDMSAKVSYRRGDKRDTRFKSRDFYWHNSTKAQFYQNEQQQYKTRMYKQHSQNHSLAANTYGA